MDATEPNAPWMYRIAAANANGKQTLLYDAVDDGDDGALADVWDLLQIPPPAL